MNYKVPLQHFIGGRCSAPLIICDTKTYIIKKRNGRGSRVLQICCSYYNIARQIGEHRHI